MMQWTIRCLVLQVGVDKQIRATALASHRRARHARRPNDERICTIESVPCRENFTTKFSFDCLFNVKPPGPASCAIAMPTALPMRRILFLRSDLYSLLVSLY